MEEVREQIEVIEVNDFKKKYLIIGCAAVVAYAIGYSAGKKAGVGTEVLEKVVEDADGNVKSKFIQKIIRK